MRFVTPKNGFQQTLSALHRVRESLVRRHSNVVACALANKLARIAWAITARHTQFEVKEAPIVQ